MSALAHLGKSRKNSIEEHLVVHRHTSSYLLPLIQPPHRFNMVQYYTLFGQKVGSHVVRLAQPIAFEKPLGKKLGIAASGQDHNTEGVRTDQNFHSSPSQLSRLFSAVHSCPWAVARPQQRRVRQSMPAARMRRTLSSTCQVRQRHPMYTANANSRDFISKQSGSKSGGSINQEESGSNKH